MSDNIKKEETKADQENKSAVKPDPETLHTTDPQKNMEGPISSLMHKTGKEFETDKSAKDADEERDKKM